MRGTQAVVLVGLILATTTLGAQTRRTTPARRAAPAPVPPKLEAVDIQCPTPLGSGVNTRRTFCDVLIGRVPANGIIIPLPLHTGDVKLMFDLHNRHTYSEESMRDKRAAFVRYTAVIGALTADNTLISRAAVQSEFRAARDLVDRIGGGAGPGGVKAVAPTGTESIVITVPAAENEVSILGEKLLVERADGAVNYSTEGRPIAIISNVRIEYQPAPVTPPKPAPRTPTRSTPRPTSKRPVR